MNNGICNVKERTLKRPKFGLDFVWLLTAKVVDSVDSCFSRREPNIVDGYNERTPQAMSGYNGGGIEAGVALWLD